MDVKQIELGNNKSMLSYSSIKRLIDFVHNLEEKLSSVKTIHDKLNELVLVVSKTHENIFEELTTIKTVLNQQKQDQDEIIEIDATKSEWDEEDDDEPTPRPASTKIFESKSVTNLSTKDQQINCPTDRLSLCSATSYESSTTTNSSNIENRTNSSMSKHSSNLKKSSQSSARAKSPKSVTFSLDQNNDSTTPIIQQQPPPTTEPQEKPSTDTNKTFSEITTPIILNSNETFRQTSDYIPDLFKQHHTEVTTKPNIGYKLGNALTNIRIHEIESKNGDYLRLLNVSNSDDYDLGGHFLQQNIACVPLSRFRFPLNTIIRSGQTLTVWCGALKNIEPQPPYVFVWKEQRRWESGPECVTVLAKPSGQAIAWARSSHRVNPDPSSSGILSVHSKCDSVPSDEGSVSNCFNRSRLSGFNFIGNNKPLYGHSPTSPTHSDHNGGISNPPNDLRLQMHQRGGLSQFLNRPKSSPFSSHTGCKQDLISLKYLQNQQKTQGLKQTSVKT